MTSEDLSRQAFRTIPLYRGPEFPCGGNTQPRRGPAIGHDEYGHEAAVNADPGRIRTLEVGPAADPLGGRQSVALTHRSALVGNRQALAALRAASFQDDSAVFCRHSYAESVRLLPAANVWLKCALSLHRCSASSTSKLPPESREETPIVVGTTRTVKGSQPQGLLCATVAGLFSGISESRFGFSPKISTDVENIVENAPLSWSLQKEPIFR